MPNDIETLAKSLLSSPQGNRIVKGLDKFNAIVSTDSGKQLITMLANGGADAVKAAATAAAQSERDQGRILLSTLLSSKEGAALAAKIIEVIGV